MSRPSSPIIWRSETGGVIILDVPHSIESAQGGDHDLIGNICSSAPLQSPFPSNEPKSRAAIDRVRATSGVSSVLHETYAELVERALREARAHHHGPWCLPRPHVAVDAEKRWPATHKRGRDPDVEGSAPAKSDHNANPSVSRDLPPSFLDLPLAFRTLSSNNGHEVQRDSADRVVVNDDEDDWHAKTIGNCTQRINLVEAKTTRGVSSASKRYSFRLPPRSAFYLADCSDAAAFHAAVRNQAQNQDTSRCFDFILLDPPWPSRSVKRTHKTPGRSYGTAATIESISNLILSMDLDMLMSDGCLVGMWITNKPGIRDLVLNEDGIFAHWGLKLEQEWVWLKVTEHGEPVTALDGLWRKPYEILLLGRRRRKLSLVAESHTGNAEPRVIFSVPDLHSRKPCLKELVEPLMPDPSNYRALEVFARHLVEGWWSWGNECIKFNWEGYWLGAKTGGVVQ